MRTWFLIALLGCGMAVYAQKPAGDCSFKTARDKSVDGDLTAYRCNSVWGVYNHVTGKEICPPKFSYVLLTPYGYLGVLNNRVGYYSSSGKTMAEPVYTRFGFVWNNPSSNEFIIFLNDSIQAGAAVTTLEAGKYVKCTMPYNWTGNQLHNLHCRMVEIQNGKAVVNNYDFTYTSDTGFEETPQSGLYDLNSGTWNIPRVCNYLVSFGNKHVALVSATSENYPQAFNYRVYDENFQATDIIADPATHLIPVTEVEKLLPYTAVTNVQLRNGPFVQGGLYYFESNGKAGLFQLDYLRVLQAPVYDAVLSPEASLYMFTVQGKKIGWIDPYSSASVFEPVYDSIWAGGLRDEENTASGILLNGKWHVLLAKNELEEVTDSVWKDFRAPYTSVYSNGAHVFLEDVIPTFYPSDPLQVMRGNQTVDSVDIHGKPVYPPSTPGKNRSGIYSIGHKKWLVPRQYATVGVAGNGLYGAVKSGNLTLFDIYDAGGRIVMPGLSSYMEISSTVIWSNLTGYEAAVRSGRVACDTGITTHALHDAVYVTAETGVGVFDLGKMKWLIDPLYAALTYLPAEEKFKAAPNDKRKTTVWFDKNGAPIKK